MHACFPFSSSLLNPSIFHPSIFHPFLIPTSWVDSSGVAPSLSSSSQSAADRRLGAKTKGFDSWIQFSRSFFLSSFPFLSPNLAVRAHMILPEILLHIALFLNRPELLVSVRVCKEWHQTLSPCIYFSIDLHQPHHGQGTEPVANRSCYPAASVIQRFGRHVRILSLSLPCLIINELALSVQQLRSLHVQSIYDASADTVDVLAKEVQLLLQNNIDIQQLHFDVIPGKKKRRVFTLLRRCEQCWINAVSLW